MVKIHVKCQYIQECGDRDTTNCRVCVNNHLRNMEINYFERAYDNPRPEVNPKVTFSGPAEQTAGYQCPVCGGFTSPYVIKENRCDHCGFKLNI